MSTLNSSPWIDESPKKRIPSMRKTVRKVTETNSKLEPLSDTFQVQEWDNDKLLIQQEKANDGENDVEINNLLEKMSLLHSDNEGSSLANFNPISYPDDDSIEQKILPQDYNKWKNTTSTASNFGMDNTNKSMHRPSDYSQAYETPVNKPYYSTTTTNDKGDKNISDTLSYIVHLLQEQQNEKTNNTMEEYVLYILLGTFVIFIVDSFSRGGKYIR